MTPSILQIQERGLHTVGMENFRGESDFRRLVRVLVAEGHAQAKNAAFPGRVGRAKNRGRPNKNVLFAQRRSACSLSAHGNPQYTAKGNNRGG
eukprot:2249375-Rhodomonas_salina.3